nr:von Willebrand factor A domain-containing protein 7 [Nothobranchius furzeri]XP_054586738.1 von Willebrand factor A domain-containing protein 7 [Nothobranchius furzeri]
MSGLALLSFLLLQTGVSSFGTYPSFINNLIFDGSLNHQEITEKAILNVTVQVCRALALTEGKDFTFPSQPLTAESVVAACEAPKSSKTFVETISQIRQMNYVTDLRYPFDPHYHCDEEKLREGQKLITDGLAAVKAANDQQNYVSAASILGRALHTLQDFYSHSNWVELRNTSPNSNLIRANADIGTIANESRKTCRSCNGDDCSNNILEDILKENILTSGYFSLLPSKPSGKCSHGNLPDATSFREPKGGINKDKFSSSHGDLHEKAANLAIAATSELLEDVRGAAGDKKFLEMMGISRGSSKALCFVVDTTGSMSNDIDAVKNVTSSIIDSKVGTEDEPSSYVLVPFNDPDFGPLMRTTDPKEFKTYINSLSAEGGGDFPEMSLSGLQLALTGTPPNSEIFLFTDATAKDEYLKNTVTALIEKTKTTVNFMITNVLGFRRRRQVSNNQQQSRQMVRSDTQLYRDLAQASGGQAIQVTKYQLLEATSIIRESTLSSLVILLQASRNPGKVENFTFSVDKSITNLTIYITGTPVDFTLINPSGVIQNVFNTTGSSVISSQSVGNFQTLRLKTEMGVWKIGMMTTNPYNLKVVGGSPVNFLFNFVKESSGPVEGFDPIDNRPTAGGNASLIVTLIGSDIATATEVTLVESSGSGQVKSTMAAQGGGQFLFRFDKIPSFEFVVLLKGQSINSNSRAASEIFQRQSSTSLRASDLTVIAGKSDTFLKPGTPQSVPFSVTTSGVGGSFTIQATNDQGFDISFPPSLSLDAGGSANGTVNITAPPDTPSGTSVTLTIEATAPGGADTNYAVLRFIFLQPVTDFTQPSCQLLSLQANCSDNCRLSVWELSVQVSDGVNGTGVASVNVRQGNGTFNSSSVIGSENKTVVSYVASCCSPDVQLVAVDQVGNVEVCSYSVRKIITPTVAQAVTEASSTVTTPTVASSTRSVQSVLFCLGFSFFVFIC